LRQIVGSKKAERDNPDFERDEEFSNTAKTNFNDQIVAVPIPIQQETKPK